jgi:hypothetical protein
MDLIVTSPSDVDTHPTITPTSTGIYDSVFTLSAAGLWTWKWVASGTITDVAYGEVTVAATGPPAYVSLDLLKTACGEIATSDRDMLLDWARFSASRAIDRRCGFPRRRFYRDADPSARELYTGSNEFYDRATGTYMLYVDDFATTAGLIVETGDVGAYATLDSASYEASSDRTDNPAAAFEAYTVLRRRTSWCVSRKVRVTACWGWPSVPDEIGEAALLQSTRLFARRNSPEGVSGNAEWGISRVSRLDPDVREMVKDFRLPGLA